MSRPADGVELVVPQDRARRASFAHRAGNLQNLSLLAATVIKVTDKDHFPVWMPENAFHLDEVDFM